jgi:hypothetical protein
MLINLSYPVREAGQAIGAAHEKKALSGHFFLIDGIGSVRGEPTAAGDRERDIRCKVALSF